MPPGPDDERIPISALQHYVYCPRQCALIHLEQTYEENVFTLRGKRVHDRVDDAGTESIEGGRQERALPVWSTHHGLTGKADLVVFPDDGHPYPVEFKAGRRKERLADDVQLCAQALCLEEMLNVEIPGGEIFYARSRRRRNVPFDRALREHTISVIEDVRCVLSQWDLPPPVADQRCPNCSLQDACRPFVINRLNEEAPA